MSAVQHRAGRAALRVMRQFREDNCFDLAAIVTFYSLLSVGPGIFLLGTTLNRIFSDRGAVETALRRMSLFVPPAASGVVERLSGELGNREGLLLLALPAMIWVGTSSISALEYAVNVAFATAPRRNAWHSRVKALCVLVAGTLVLAASLLTHTVTAQLVRFRVELGLPAAPDRLASLGSYAVMLGVSFGTFCLFYKVLPRGRVCWSAAASGAVLALALWEPARRLFGGILLRSPTFGLLTGTLAGIVAFLLWIYTAVAVTLAGAELAALLNGNRERP